MSRARVLVGCAVSLLLLGYFLQRAEVASMLDALRTADYRGLVPAILIYLGGVWVRALRWKFLLDPVAKVSTGRLFQAVLIGFTANNLLPARLGEIARAVLIGRWANVPPAATLGTIVVERLFDGLTLCAILAVGWLWVAPTGWLRQGAFLATAAFLGAAVLVTLAAVRPGLVLAIARAFTRPLPDRFRERALRLCSIFLSGLAVVRDLRTLLVVIALSFVAWFCEAGMYYVIMAGFGIETGPHSALLAMVAANLGTTVPSSPSFIGTFDVPLQAVLVELFDVEPSLAASYTLVVHAALVIPVVIIGLLLLSREGLSLGELSRRTAGRRVGLSASTDPARPAL